MRHIGIALLVVAMVFGFTAAAQAERGQPRTPEQNLGPWQGRHMVARIVGEVTGISGNTLTLTATIRGQTQVLVLTFDRTTQFGAAHEGKDARAAFKWRRANEVTSADLEVGQQVKVFYIVGENVAETIVITSSRAPSGAGNPGTGTGTGTGGSGSGGSVNNIT